MRSNAPASPCWARRMASASVISLDSDRLVRVTVPVGTHPVCGMHPWLLELHSSIGLGAGLVPASVPSAGHAALPRGELGYCPLPYFLWKSYVRLGLTVRMVGT